MSLLATISLDSLFALTSVIAKAILYSFDPSQNSENSRLDLVLDYHLHGLCRSKGRELNSSVTYYQILVYRSALSSGLHLPGYMFNFGRQKLKHLQLCSRSLLWEFHQGTNIGQKQCRENQEILDQKTPMILVMGIFFFFF